VEPIAGYPDAFELTRVVDGDDAPLELNGTTAHLFVKQLVVRNLISDWGVKPRSADWRAILDESAAGFDDLPSAGR
jgi:hypothetical protein